MRADLRGIERGIAALTQHVSVGEQAAQVRVAGVVEREEHDVGVPFGAPAHPAGSAPGP